MKKITFLSVFLLLLAWGSHAQCIRTAAYPSATTPSNNVGLPQTITTGVYTSEYSQISNVTVGGDYIFTCKVTTSGVEKYITVTDGSNVVIAHGESPLTVEDITSSTIRLHYSDNADCASTSTSHTAIITAVLDCSPPINLTAGGITTTNATLGWEPQGSETAWEVVVLPSTADAPTAATEGIEVNNDPTYTTNLLTAGGLFKFYVRSNCGSESSPWNGPFNFATLCNPALVLNENFDTLGTGVLPICWAQIKNGTGVSPNAYAYVTNYNFNSPSRVAILNNSDSQAGANVILATPTLGNLAAGTHRAKFFARSGGATGSLQVGTVDNTTADAVFTDIETIALTSTHTEFAVDFTGYEGTDTHLAFRLDTEGTYSTIFIDDIRWEVAPLCADVSEITIEPTSITDSSATVTWAANGSETQWDVVYGLTTDNDPNALTPISPAPSTTPEANLSGLTDNTTYRVWVRSVCGTDLGAWVGPKTFKTNCVGVDVLNENFDTYAYASMADCWAGVKNGTGVSQYANVQVADWNFHSPSRSLQLNNSDSQAGANIVLASPVLTNIATGTNRVKFYARSSGATGSLQVGTIDNTSADGYFTGVETIALTSTYAEFVVEFTDTEITDNRIAFRHNSTGTYTSVFLDNIIWEPIPLCADVTEITVTETTVQTASLTWTAGGSETEWDVVYGAATVTDPNTLTPISPAPTVNSQATIAGLSDNTSYKVWVRSVCGAQNGAWIGPITFKTPCLPATSLEENFDTTAYAALPDCWSAVKNGTGISQYANVYALDYNFYSSSRTLALMNSDSGADANIIAVSPNLSNVSAGTHRVKFFARSSGSAGSVQVGTVDNTTGEAVFTEVETVDLNSTYAEYAVNFTGYEGTDTYVAFRHNTSGTYTTIYLDNVRWEVAPLCADVKNIVVEAISSEGGTVAWESQGSETNWQVVYGPTSTTDPETLTPSALLTDTYFPVSELTPNTSYKVWVRSSCGGTNGNGAWIGPVQFSTLCVPTVVPYTQDFESATTPSLPNCSVMQNLSEGNNWRTVNNPGNGFTSKTLNYNYTYADNANVWYYTRGISLTAGTEYTISYRYGNNSTTSYKENLTVKYGNAANADDMTEEIGEHLDIQTGTAEENEVTFSVPVTGVYYFGFQAHSIAGQDQLYVDDIVVEAALGTKDFSSADFKFYPNPVKDVLNLSYIQNISNVSVFNLLGQKVLENTTNATSAQVDMSNLASGSYLVKVTSDNQTKTIKVIKE